MREIAAARGGDDAGLPEWPLPNVWLGVSVEDQATADERIPLLLQTPAAVRWVSAEPLLNFVDLERVAWPNKREHRVDVLRGGYWNKANCITWGPSADLNEAKGGFTNHSDFPSTLDWVVCGGESGMKNARPMHAEWARKLHDDCAASGVSFYMKQLGAAFVDEKNGIAGAGLQVDPDVVCMVSRSLRDRAGADINEWPEDLRVRECPKEASDAST